MTRTTNFHHAISFNLLSISTLAIALGVSGGCGRPDAFDDVNVEPFGTSQQGLFTGTISLANVQPGGLYPAERYTEQNVGDQGGSAAVVGDFDGNGIKDLAVADMGYDPAGTTAVGGRVYVYYGSLLGSASSLGAADVIFDAEATSGQQLGYSLAAADLNGDGADELLMTAGEYNSARGVAYVVFGGGVLSGVLSLTTISPTSTTLPGVRLTGGSNAERVRNVANLGDIDGDGFTDVAIGQRYQTSTVTNGRVSIIYGRANFNTSFTAATNLLSNVADVRINGAATGNELEFCGPVGDLDADGLADFALGADRANTNRGSLYVVYGSTVRLSGTVSVTSVANATFTSTGSTLGTGTRIGRSFAGGDVNADGFDDLIFGAYGATNGAAFIRNGGATRFSGTYLYTSTSYGNAYVRGVGATDFFGYAVSYAGDVNNDGFGDVLIGAHQRSTNTGSVYLLRGSAAGITGALNALNVGGSVPGATFNGVSTYNMTGYFVGNAGDINADGFNDFLIGSPSTPSNGRVGTLHLVYGQ